jgi:hypothetical protein
MKIQWERLLIDTVTNREWSVVSYVYLFILSLSLSLKWPGAGFYFTQTSRATVSSEPTPRVFKKEVNSTERLLT